MSVRFCQSCVLPDSRPGIRIGEDGICNACKGHADNRTNIDWAAREGELHRIIDDVKSRGSVYNCIVPVSGGKDSFWQIIQCLKMGLKVLAVTWKSPGRNELGQANLDALVRLGVDHVDFAIDPVVEAKFMRKTLIETGLDGGSDASRDLRHTDEDGPVRMNIPLIVWGESPFMEYGGDAGDSDLDLLNHAWLKRHGILQGREAQDWIGDELSPRELEPFTPRPRPSSTRRTSLHLPGLLPALGSFRQPAGGGEARVPAPGGGAEGRPV